MKIEHVKIKNFRSISHVEYDLRRVNLFTGPNQTGKTNTIQAIFWALTDIMLDGSSDFESIKPLYDTSRKALVELAFDTGLTLQKTYSEKWVKTKGSEEKTMTGHETTYMINGIKTGVTAARKQLREIFLAGQPEKGKFDLLRALIDPLYCGSKCDWKIFREFIIDLCGDVSPDDVVASDPALSPVMNRIRTDGYDTSKTMKYYKQVVAKCRKEIEEDSAKVEALQSIAKPSDDDINAARIALQDIDRAITDIKAGREAQILTNAEDVVRSAIIDVREAEQADRDDANLENADIDYKINTLQSKSNDLVARQQEQTRTVSKVQSEIYEIENRIRSLSLELNNAEARKKMLTERYVQISKEAVPDEQTCPNCGYVINQEQINQHETDRGNRLKVCAEEGKAVVVQIDNLKFDIEEERKLLSDASKTLEESKAINDKLTESIKKVSADILAFSSSKVKPTESERTKKAKEALAKAEAALATAKADAAVQNRDMEHQIQTLEASKSIHLDTIGLKAAYEQTLKRVDEYNSEISAAMKHQTDAEQMLALVSRYIQCRLNLFKKRIEDVFGTRLQIQLIEENIKEGSWNECCIPKIVDKDTPFSDGSGSEQIITGIYIAECVKKRLHIPDLPYIFDECDKLDTAHLGSLDTTAQIISTIVNDIDYKKIALVSSD